MTLRQVTLVLDTAFLVFANHLTFEVPQGWVENFDVLPRGDIWAPLASGVTRENQLSVALTSHKLNPVPATFWLRWGNKPRMQEMEWSFSDVEGVSRIKTGFHPGRRRIIPLTIIAVKK